MPGRIADIFQIIVFAAGPDTFLGSGCPYIVSFVLPEKNTLELHHSGIDKQQRWVFLGYQRRTADNPMVMLFKIIKKLFAYVVTGHQYLR